MQQPIRKAFSSVLLVLSAVCLCLSGCMVGPDYEPREVELPEQWIAGDQQISGEPDDYAEWWKFFQDPILDRLIETAYSENLTLEEAGLRVLEGRARLGIAVGGFFPQTQGISGGYNRVGQSRNTANVLPSTSFDSYSVGFNAAWELDFWGKFRRGIEADDASLYADIATYDDVLNALVAEVARTYIVIRTLEARLAYANQNADIQRESLEIAEVQFRNGGVTELDVTQARTILEETLSLIPAFESGIQQAKNALCVLLGRAPEDLSEFFDDVQLVGRIPIAPPQVAVGIPAELLRRRPDVRRAERLAAAQSAEIGVAVSQLLPAITIDGSIGWEARDLSDLFESGSGAGFIGVNFNWPIFNYGRLINNIRVQDARFQQALTNYENTVYQAAAEVENGLVGFVENQRVAGHLAEASAASERSVSLATTQYRLGATDYTRLIQTQTSLVANQDALAATRGDVSIELVNAFKSLGGGWQMRIGEEFVRPETLAEMSERTNWWGDDMFLPDADPENAHSDALFAPKGSTEPRVRIIPAAGETAPSDPEAMQDE